MRREPRMGRSVEEEASDLATIFNTIAVPLRRFLLGVTKDVHAADDAAQAAFAKALEVRPKGSPDALRAWLFKVALNEALARRRADRRFQEAAKSLAWLKDGRAPGLRDGIEDREEIERIQRQLERLPVVQQMVVRKRLVEEKTFAEIAREERLPLGTVLTRMRLALETLRARLGERN